MKIKKAQDFKNKQLKNFLDTMTNTPEQEKERKIKENADYIAYIKEHDKEAYQNYLSYSTYLYTTSSKFTVNMFHVTFILELMPLNL